MESVLISIQPKWVDKIVSGEKTVEVRKSKPKLKTPFKCYIYETRTKYKTRLLGLNCVCQGKGKVVGEFICDNILHSNENAFIGNKPLTQYVLRSSCLTMEEINQYRQDKNIYAWHITDLKIYDKPKELSEFKSAFHCFNLKNVECKINAFSEYVCQYYDNSFCRICKYYNSDFGDCDKPAFQPLKRPPQSWCYVWEFEQ